MQLKSYELILTPEDCERIRDYKDVETGFYNELIVRRGLCLDTIRGVHGKAVDADILAYASTDLLDKWKYKWAAGDTPEVLPMACNTCKHREGEQCIKLNKSLDGVVWARCKYYESKEAAQ